MQTLIIIVVTVICYIQLYFVLRRRLNFSNNKNQLLLYLLWFSLYTFFDPDLDGLVKQIPIGLAIATALILFLTILLSGKKTVHIHNINEADLDKLQEIANRITALNDVPQNSIVLSKSGLNYYVRFLHVHKKTQKLILEQFHTYIKFHGKPPVKKLLVLALVILCCSLFIIYKLET